MIEFVRQSGANLLNVKVVFLLSLFSKGLVHAKAQVAIERSPYSTCHSDFGQNLAPTLRDSDQSRNDKCALACTKPLNEPKMIIFGMID